MMLLLEGLVKSSVILLAVLLVVPLLRHQSAAFRHWILSAALVGAALAPVAQYIVPTWEVPIAVESTPSAGDVISGAGKDGSLAQAGTAATARPLAQSAPISMETAITAAFATWVTGAVFAFAVLIAGLSRLAWLASCSPAFGDARWIEQGRLIAREYGLRHAKLLRGVDPHLLVAWGVRRANVIVPPAATAWSDERVRMVLYHELAHVRRGDWVMQLIAETMRAIYWFNPLVWMVCARLRQESEQACDDEVIGRGIEGSEYASHLIAIARDLRQRRIGLPAPAIARVPSLERRVRAMLDAGINRRRPSRPASVFAFVAVMAITVPIAGIAAAQAFGSLRGAIVDPTNGLLPGVTLVLTNEQTKAKYEVQTDRNGRYEFVGLPPGDYSFETKLPGFSTFRGKVAITGVNLQQDVTLQVGELRETVTIVGGKSAPELPAAVVVEKIRQTQVVVDRYKEQQIAKCGGNASNTSGPRIGGNIRTPRKIVDVSPRYPSHLQGIEGVVALRAIIGPDGIIQDIVVQSSAHPDLTAATTEAVSQWRFTETLLNCVAIPVTMNVTAQFRYQP